MTTYDQVISIKAEKKPRTLFLPRAKFYPFDKQFDAQAIITNENTNLFPSSVLKISSSLARIKLPFRTFLKVNYDGRNPGWIRIERIGLGRRMLTVGRDIHVLSQIFDQPTTDQELAGIIEQKIIEVVREMRKEKGEELKRLKKTVRILIDAANACQ